MDSKRSSPGTSQAIGMAGLAGGWTSIASIVLPRFAANHIQGYSLVTVYFGCAGTVVSMGTVAIKRLTGRVDPIVAMPIICL